jgi:hypothetical protein
MEIKLSRRNTKSSAVAGKVMSRDQNAGKNGNIQAGEKLFDTVKQFKHLGTTLTNQTSIHDEIKSRLKSGNACYNSVQNLLSSSL